MRPFSTVIAFSAVALHATNTHAIPPQAVFISSAADSYSGIPDVKDAVNPICIPFYGLRDAIMGGLFQGRCNLNAKAAIRISFHDAGPFSLASQAAGLPNSGADGSIIVYPEELTRDLNNGLQTIAGLLAPLPDQFNVSPGDVVHLAGTLGLLACPGGPSTTVFVGRPPPRNIAPDGFLPNSAHSIEFLTARFADMGFSEREMVTLVGVHSIGKQMFIDPTKINATFDTTPDVLDTRFYTETRDGKVTPHTILLDSDVGFATQPPTAKHWESFIGNQTLWAIDYAAAHEKLSVLGLDPETVAGLIDCSEILPLPIDITKLLVPGPVEGGEEPMVDPVKLEAVTRRYRSIWLA
ncbi:Peroxidase [Mycena sanguinolenta]|uniref:Peroxidase n=1 Tax=Mycena sanguinolenta TaxID=230812 RepID=A0A8H6YCA8_9AGAR|nr:Peroxidase [Mycena sanguinolenta]